MSVNGGLKEVVCRSSSGISLVGCVCVCWGDVFALHLFQPTNACDIVLNHRIRDCKLAFV